jgi:hypothetical protein
MHTILCSGFDVVKVLPLHEVKCALAVKVVRYGYPFVRIHRILDFSICLANRASDSQWSFLGGIMQSPKEVAGGVDPMCGLYTANFTRLSKEFWFRDRKELSRGRVSSSELRSSSSPSPTSSPPDGDDESSSSSLK